MEATPVKLGRSLLFNDEPRSQTPSPAVHRVALPDSALHHVLLRAFERVWIKCLWFLTPRKRVGAVLPSNSTALQLNLGSSPRVIK